MVEQKFGNFIHIFFLRIAILNTKMKIGELSMVIATTTFTSIARSPSISYGPISRPAGGLEIHFRGCW